MFFRKLVVAYTEHVSVCSAMCDGVNSIIQQKAGFQTVFESWS